jgi:hypothetical protein
MSTVTIEKAKLEQALDLLRYARSVASFERNSEMDSFIATMQALAAQPAVQEPVAQSLIDALTHAVEIAESKRPGTWDDLLQYRVLLNTPPAQPDVPDAIHHTDLSEHPQYIEGWNDCRAEMLKGMK